MPQDTRTPIQPCNAVMDATKTERISVTVNTADGGTTQLPMRQGRNGGTICGAVPGMVLNPAGRPKGGAVVEEWLDILAAHDDLSPTELDRISKHDKRPARRTAATHVLLSAHAGDIADYSPWLRCEIDDIAKLKLSGVGTYGVKSAKVTRTTAPDGSVTEVRSLELHDRAGPAFDRVMDRTVGGVKQRGEQVVAHVDATLAAASVLGRLEALGVRVAGTAAAADWQQLAREAGWTPPVTPLRDGTIQRADGRVATSPSPPLVSSESVVLSGVVDVSPLPSGSVSGVMSLGDGNGGCVGGSRVEDSPLVVKALVGDVEPPFSDGTMRGEATGFGCDVSPGNLTRHAVESSHSGVLGSEGSGHRVGGAGGEAGSVGVESCNGDGVCDELGRVHDESGSLACEESGLTQEASRGLHAKVAERPRKPVLSEFGGVRGGRYGEYLIAMRLYKAWRSDRARAGKARTTSEEMNRADSVPSIPSDRPMRPRMEDFPGAELRSGDGYGRYLSACKAYCKRCRELGIEAW